MPPAGRLTLNYLLADTALNGGTKVALHQANLMTRRGHRVRVIAPAPPPVWYPVLGEYRRVTSLREPLPGADVHVATFWTTIRPAMAAGSGQAVHFCQGFEGSYTHNLAEHAEIELVYSMPLPALAVAPHLAALLRQRFGRASRVVAQPLDPCFRPRHRNGPAALPRVLVVSPFEIDWKGVPVALQAVRRLRSSGQRCQLVRLSQWPLSAAERALMEPDEYHENLTPPQVARVIAGCDVMLAPSWEQEGFGMPVLEAMACGVPVVASDIACFRDFALPAAALVPSLDVDAFVGAARSLLRQRGTWRRARRKGIAVARRFREPRSQRDAEAAMRWVVSGRWRIAMPGVGER